MDPEDAQRPLVHLVLGDDRYVPALHDLVEQPAASDIDRLGDAWRERDKARPQGALDRGLGLSWSASELVYS